MEEIIRFFNQKPDVFLIAVAAVSLLVGSFLNVLIYRLPKMLINTWNQDCREYLGLKPNDDFERFNLYLPLSHCINCKNRLKPWHNIPIISYMVLWGKCAYCSSNISFRYPLVELLCCLTSVYVAWKFGVSLQTVGGLLFTWIIIALLFIDLDYQTLPDNLTLLLLWSGLLFSLFSVFTTPQDAILGAAAGYLVFAITQEVFHFFTGKVGMGRGDYKFLAALGAFLGWQQLPLIILLSSFIGIIFTFTHMFIKKQYKSVPIPFGPYLAIAGWISLMWGTEILHLYLHKLS